MKKDGRLQLRIDKALLVGAQKVSKEKGVSLSFLVEQYFRELIEEHQLQANDDGVRQI